MDRYLRYGLPLFAVWIIATRIISLIYLVFKGYPNLVMYVYYYIGLSIIAGLLAVVAGIVILVEISGKGWDMKRIAMMFLGLTLILVGAYNMLFHAFFNILIPGMSLSAGSQTVVGWILNVFRGLHGIAALLILVSLQEEGSVAKIGLFLYGIVTIAGIAFHYFGMEGNPGIGLILALLGVLAGLLILKRR